MIEDDEYPEVMDLTRFHKKTSTHLAAAWPFSRPATNYTLKNKNNRKTWRVDSSHIWYTSYIIYKFAYALYHTEQT